MTPLPLLYITVSLMQRTHVIELSIAHSKFPQILAWKIQNIIFQFGFI